MGQPMCKAGQLSPPFGEGCEARGHYTGTEGRNDSPVSKPVRGIYRRSSRRQSKAQPARAHQVQFVEKNPTKLAEKASKRAPCAASRIRTHSPCRQHCLQKNDLGCNSCDTKKKLQHSTFITQLQPDSSVTAVKAHVRRGG